MERTIISFDYAIKDILRDKANFDILSGFLTELIEQPVAVQAVLKSEGNSSTVDGKVNHLDLMTIINDSELAVFEIQYFDQLDFFGEIVFKACKAIVEQISSGETDIKKIYSINISHFRMEAKDEYMFVANLNEFKGIHFDEIIPFSQYLDPRGVPKDIHSEYFLIIPKKYKEENDDKNENNKKVRTKNSKFDEWVYVLKNAVVKSDFTAAGIQAAGDKLNVLKMTPQQRAQYEADRRLDLTLKTQLYTAEQKGRIAGRAAGRAKVEAERRAEVEAEAKGRENAIIDIVIRGHKKGFSIETIAELTELSHEQILKILNEK